MAASPASARVALRNPVASPLLPDSSGEPRLKLDALTIEGETIHFRATTIAERVACPGCRHASERVHSRYQRRPLDLPWQGRTVRIDLTSRKWRCENVDCPRRIFTEPLPGVVGRYARKTNRLAAALRELVLLAGGEAAARIAAAFGLLVSPDALLDAVKANPACPAPTPRVLGVDDFAFRKGRRYGTILVDLETRRPIDLLPDREPDTLVAWLRAHPGVEIISRDRGAAYREGATRGAPDALQVADRFHLVKNLADALEHFLLRQHDATRALAATMARESVDTAQRNGVFPPLADPSPQSLTPAQQEEKQMRRSRRLARYEQVRRMESEGLSRREIARRAGMSRNTVRRFLDGERFPEIASKPTRSGKLTPFLTHLRQRWMEGCHDATRLHREIVALGFEGSLDLVQRGVASWREAPRGRKTARCPAPMVPTCGHLAFVLMNPEHPKASESMLAFARRLAQENPLLGRAQALAGEFCRLIRERAVEGLSGWLEAASASGIAELKGFAGGLVQDRAAVEAALSCEWSNGQVEGQVNRLKFLKRSMYGRGSIDLLRARVLHRAKAMV